MKPAVVKIACLSVVYLGLCAHGVDGQRVKADDGHAYGLDGMPPGIAVVRDSTRWSLLLRRYGPDVKQTEPFPSWVPVVDFTRDAMIVVSFGVQPMCDNIDQYIYSVVERRDSIVLNIGLDVPPMQGVCPALGHLSRIIRVANAKPVALHVRRRLPSHLSALRILAAPWWDQAAAEDVVQMKEDDFAYAFSLARLPSTSLATVIAIIRNTKDWPEWPVYDMLVRADVRGSPEALMLLARKGIAVAGDSLFSLHGVALARDSTTQAEMLQPLVERVGRQDLPHRLEVARALLTNSTVVNTRELSLRYLINLYLDRELFVEGCKGFLARWSPWRPAIDHAGRLFAYHTNLDACPGMPPQPRVPPPAT